VLDVSADTLHGDATLAARLCAHVLPSFSVPQGLLGTVCTTRLAAASSR